MINSSGLYIIFYRVISHGVVYLLQNHPSAQYRRYNSQRLVSVSSSPLDGQVDLIYMYQCGRVCVGQKYSKSEEISIMI